MGKFVPDVDIDFQNRDKALEGLLCIPASMVQNGELRRHNVGVYFQAIPQDPLTGFSGIPYEEAESRGYFKIDFLNLNVYKDVRDEAHLDDLISREPMWELLTDEDIVGQLFQLGRWAELTAAYAPKSILELAMVLAVIRPGKQHLMGLPFEELEREIWQVDPLADDDYAFKKAHAISYAHVIVVQLNLLLDKVNAEPEV
jgi:hypothetical protein